MSKFRNRAKQNKSCFFKVQTKIEINIQKAKQKQKQTKTMQHLLFNQYFFF